MGIVVSIEQIGTRGPEMPAFPISRMGEQGAAALAARGTGRERHRGSRNKGRAAGWSRPRQRRGKGRAAAA